VSWLLSKELQGRNPEPIRRAPTCRRRGDADADGCPFRQRLPRVSRRRKRASGAAQALRSFHRAGRQQGHAIRREPVSAPVWRQATPTASAARRCAGRRLAAAEAPRLRRIACWVVCSVPLSAAGRQRPGRQAVPALPYCRFRKPYPVEWRRLTNRNIIAVDDRNCPPFRPPLCDCFKSRSRLEAEIVVLRHQLNVLRLRAPRLQRVTTRKSSSAKTTIT
jgi:hypothetical protein